MPSANWTVPDSSPWIRYVGAWYDSDADTQDYTNGTFHFTNSSGASASCVFNGTGATIYGAKRPNHGTFTVTLDGVVTTVDGATANSPGDFNVSLFHRDGLNPAQQHSLTISNTPHGSGDVDVDWLEIEVGDGNLAVPSQDVWLDDTSANITYDKNWAVGHGKLNSAYYNSTFRATSTLNAKATIDFYGDAIALYGAVSINHAAYAVSLDGGPSATFNGTASVFRPQMLLYMANNLPHGPHQLVLSNAGSGANGYTDLDYAIVSVWAAPPVDAPAPSNEGVAPVGAIIGGVGGLVGLLLLLGLAWTLWRRRRPHVRAKPLKMDLDGTSSVTHLTPWAATVTPFTEGGPDLCAEEDMPPPTYDCVFPTPGSEGLLRQPTQAESVASSLRTREKRRPQGWGAGTSPTTPESSSGSSSTHLSQ